MKKGFLVAVAAAALAIASHLGESEKISPEEICGELAPSPGRISGIKKVPGGYEITAVPGTDIHIFRYSQFTHKHPVIEAQIFSNRPWIYVPQPTRKDQFICLGPKEGGEYVLLK